MHLLIIPAVLLSYFVLKRLRRALQRSSLLPPGPKGFPIVGNMFDVPSVAPWKTFSEWSEVYGQSYLLSSLLSSLVKNIDAQKFEYKVM